MLAPEALDRAEVLEIRQKMSSMQGTFNAPNSSRSTMSARNVVLPREPLVVCWRRKRARAPPTRSEGLADVRRSFAGYVAHRGIQSATSSPASR
jgi:1,2-phenylacetyl-CoA epoxidase PaaB subunit